MGYTSRKNDPKVFFSASLSMKVNSENSFLSELTSLLQNFGKQGCACIYCENIYVIYLIKNINQQGFPTSLKLGPGTTEIEFGKNSTRAGKLGKLS